MGARITGPSAGTWRLPVTRGRNQARTSQCTKTSGPTGREGAPGVDHEGHATPGSRVRRLGFVGRRCRLGGPAGVATSDRRLLGVQSHDSTSSTTSSTARPVVSSSRASAAWTSGEVARLESRRSRRATPSGASSWRRRARSSGAAVR